MRFVRWLAFASLVACSAAACGKCGEGPPKPAAVDLAPVAAPDRLLADIYVMSPNQSWAKLQRGVGGPMGILPASAGGILCAAVGIDPAVAFEVDGVSPAFGVLAGDPAAPSWGFALKILDMRHARAILVDGETARFTPREAAGFTELLPKGQAQPPHGAVALSANGFLVVTKRSEDLSAFAPYLTRNLPKAKAPEGAIVAEVPKSAIAQVIKPKLEASWADAKQWLLAEDDRMRKDHGGRAPDYGDPKAIVTALDGLATRRLEVVGDLEKMRLVLEIDDRAATLVATMFPAAGGGAATKWVDGMKTGDAAAVLAMPQSSGVALSMRDTEEERTAESLVIEKAITESLGDRVGAAESKRVHDIATSLASARGETLGVALAWDEPRGLFVRSAVKQRDAASQAITSLVDLGKASPFKEMLRVKDVVSSTEDVGGAKANVATITREPAKTKQEMIPSAKADAGFTTRPRTDVDGGAPHGGKDKDALGFAWIVDDASLAIATGSEPIVTLRSGAKPDKKLADELQTARAVAALGNTASTVIVAQPLRFSPIRANLPPAPVVIAIGKQEKNAFVKIDLSTGILRELSRFGMGF